MAIPATPTNFYVQTGNNEILVSWDISVGATSYTVNRSLDGVNYTLLATVSPNQYLDLAVTQGTQYFYQVASVNVDGTSPFTTPQSGVPTVSGEMSLGAIRLAAQQRADRVNSNFVTLPEWNSYINQAQYELYDLLITAYEDYSVAQPITFVADGSTFSFPLPNGVNYNAAPGYYKLLGVDLALNSSANGYVTVNKFNFIDRNRFVYPNTASTIYGVFNLQYRVMGSNMMFIPTPSGGQNLRIWYVPRLPQLLKDTDVTTIGVSGWIEYVIVRAAKYALDKEESDTTKFDQQLLFLKTRIEEAAQNRDAGRPDTISDVRQGSWSDGWSGGSNGAVGGFMLAPALAFNNVAYHGWGNTVFSAQGALVCLTAVIAAAYFLNLHNRELSRRIGLAFISDLIARSSTTLLGHISKIVSLSAQKQVLRFCASRVVAFVTNIKAICNGAFKKLVGMASGNPPMNSYAESRSTVGKEAALPIPTAVGLDNFTHKSIFNREFPSHSKSLRASDTCVKRIS